MKVAIFAPYALWTHHFATDLEIAQRHIDAGDDLTILTCHGQMRACDINVRHLRFECATCSGIQSAGIKLLSKPICVQPFSQLTAADRAQLNEIQFQFTSIEALKAYHIDGFDIGMAALSSLVSIRRDPEVDLGKDAQLLKRLLHTAWIVYRSFFNFLSANDVDRVYTFNARFAPLRGVLRACQNHSVDCLIHDRGCDRHHYALYLNTFPHDQALIHERICDAWQSAATNPQREKISRSWYEGRAQGLPQSWFSFTADQQAGLLPANWDKSKRNVVIFSSSEDEFVAINDEWNNTVYPSQLEAMRQLLASIGRRTHNLHLYLRLHPNLAEVDNRQTRELHELRANCLTVIGARDEISTYALMQAADKVVTFRSTAGIEAVYWGTPSILVGPSFYADLGATYNATTHVELLELIEADLAPKDPEPALMYGYYFATFGTPFRYFTADNFFDGRFKNEELRPGLADRIKVWFLKRPHSLRRKLAMLAASRGKPARQPPQSKAA